MSQCFTAEQMGNSSTETKSENLKILIYTTYLMGKNLVKKFEEKKMFYKLFGSKQNSVLNGRDI